MTKSTKKNSPLKANIFFGFTYWKNNKYVYKIYFCKTNLHQYKFSNNFNKSKLSSYIICWIDIHNFAIYLVKRPKHNK